MNISESILEAIDIVIQQRLQQLNFDNTIICTVVDSSKREEGEYTVEYQDSIRLTVYSENKTYLNDSKVYVLVPEGDWSKQKTILGRYKAEDANTPITYVSPSTQVAIVETKSSDVVYQLQTQTTGIMSDSFITLEIPNGAEIATISADFQALISDTLLPSGRYGLYIEGYTSDNILDRSYTLGSVDVFGNPYNLPAPQRIEKNINVKDLKQLKIYAYEMSFAEKTGYVTISNISAIFGYDILSREDNTLEIMGEEPLRYNSSTDSIIERKLSLFWFNKDKNNQYLGFSDGEFNKEKAKPVEDQQIDYDKTYYWIEWERSDDGGNVWKSIQKNEETITEILSSTASTIFKAYLYVNGEKISSNTITYINEANDLAQTQLSVSLKIINDKNALDNYALYGANGVLNNSGDAYTERVLSYDYSLPEAHKESVKGSYLAETDTKVIWRIPVDSTMIAAPKVVEEPAESDLYWILSTDKKYYEYHTKVTPVKGEDGELKSVDLGNMPYRIKNTFEPWAINNTIYLEIIQILNGTTYTYKAEKTISFSSFGSSGTNYTFIAKPSRQAYYINETIDEDLIFELFDKDGNLQGEPLKYEPDENNQDYIKATTEVEWLSNKNTTLTTYYPTATAADAAYSYEGPTFVTYDSFGANPTYYREALKLHGYEGVVKWSAGENEKDINIKNKDSIYTAEFSNLFAADSTLSIRVWHINAYSENDELLWTQPVLGLQNKYGSDLLNNWDGSLQINENDNRVLAASIVAGTKSDNQFTGIALGELNDITDSNKKNISNGLLGFKNGVQTFGFNTNGSAFIGPAGSGRIYFDGDPDKGGIIASQGWINPETGMPLDSDGKGLKINLQDGSLVSQNFSINSDGSATFEGIIKAQEGNIGGWDITPGGLGKIVTGESGIWLDARPFSVDNTSAYYINCQNYKETSKYFRVGKDGSIHATSGNIGGWNITKTYIGAFGDNSNHTYFLCQSGIETYNHTTKGDTNNTLYLTGNFCVDTSGILYAKGAQISGVITATSGSIGDWTLINRGLSYNDKYFFYRGWENNDKVTVAGTEKNDWRLLLGRTNKEEKTIDGVKVSTSQAKFGVDKDGILYANGAVISGTLTAGAGSKIGPLSINENSIGVFSDDFTATYITSTIITTSQLSAQVFLSDSYGKDAHDNIFSSQAVYCAASSYSSGFTQYAVSLGPAGFILYDVTNNTRVKTIPWSQFFG